MNSNLGGAFGWIWAVFAGVGGVGFIAQGHVGSGTLGLISAAAALPPLWKKLAANGKGLPRIARFGIGGAAFVGMAVLNPSTNKSTDKPFDLAPMATAKPDQLAAALTEIQKKIAKGAISPMDRAGFPKMYTKLGRSKFELANELSKWVAVAVAQSDSCTQVDVVGVSEKSDRKGLVWFVDCANRERFMVTEDQARDARTIFDAKATSETRQLASKSPALEPVSAQWRNFDEVGAVSKCDQLVTSAAINRGSVDTAWKWQVSKNNDTGRATIERDFDAKNGFGGTISSRYRCVVSTDGAQVIGLSIQELNGWKKII